MQQKQYLRSQLQKAYTQYTGMPLDTLLEQNTYLNYLDFLAKKQFDRQIAQELFDQCPKKQQAYISINDFIDTYFKAEDELVRQVSLVNQKISTLSDQREDLMGKIDDSGKKRANQYDQQNSQLQVNIHIQTAQITSQAYENDQNFYYIVVECGGVSKATPASNNFYFDSQIQLSVSKDSQLLNIFLHPQVKKTKEIYAGKITMDISKMPQNQPIPIKDNFKNLNSQPIPIQLQYVVNINSPKTEFRINILLYQGNKYESKFDEKNIKLQEKENQLKEIDLNLKTLYQLIRNLDEINSTTQEEVYNQSYSPPKKVQVNVNHSRNQSNMSNNSKSQNEVLKQKETQGGNNNILYSYDERILLRNFKITTGFFLVLSALQCVEKPCFLEIGTLLAILGLVCSDDLNAQYTLYLGAFIVIQLGIDFTWTMLYDLTDYYERFKPVDNCNNKYLMISCYCVMILCFFYKFFYLHMIYLYYNNIGSKLDDIKMRS